MRNILRAILMTLLINRLVEIVRDILRDRDTEAKILRTDDLTIERTAFVSTFEDLLEALKDADGFTVTVRDPLQTAWSHTKNYDTDKRSRQNMPVVYPVPRDTENHSL